jgi:flagellar biosynthesis protein FlhF
VSAADLRRALTSWTAAIAEGEDEDARVEVFVGPTGAGKTTTVAKIAARARISAGRRLGLVSTDTLRVGAIEQLRLYAEIIGSPFVAARTPADLAAALTAGPAPILVDTAARVSGDGNTRDLLSILASTPGARIHLVVPAGMTAADFTRVLDTHAAVRPQRVVITKTDEGGSIAPLAGALRARGLRISYLGTGQRVPEDLRRATPAAIAAALVGDVYTEAGHAA